MTCRRIQAPFWLGVLRTFLNVNSQLVEEQVDLVILYPFGSRKPWVCKLERESHEQLEKKYCSGVTANTFLPRNLTLHKYLSVHLSLDHSLLKLLRFSFLLSVLISCPINPPLTVRVFLSTWQPYLCVWNDGKRKRKSTAKNDESIRFKKRKRSSLPNDSAIIFNMPFLTPFVFLGQFYVFYKLQLQFSLSCVIILATKNASLLHEPKLRHKIIKNVHWHFHRFFCTEPHFIVYVST